MQEAKKTVAILGDAPTAVDVGLRRILKLGKNTGSVIILDYTGRGAMMLGPSNRMGLLHQRVSWFDLADRQRPVRLFCLNQSDHFREVMLRVLGMLRVISRSTVTDSTLSWATEAAGKLSASGGVNLFTLLKSFSSVEIRRWFLDSHHDPQDLKSLLEMLHWALRYPSVYGFFEGPNRPDLRSLFEKPAVLWLELRKEYFERHEHTLMAGLVDAAIEDLILSLAPERRANAYHAEMTIAHLFPPASLFASMPSWISKTRENIRHFGIFGLHPDRPLSPLAVSWIEAATEVWIPGRMRSLENIHETWLTADEISSVNGIKEGDLWIRSNQNGGHIVAKVGEKNERIDDAYRLRQASAKSFRPSPVMQMSAASEIAAPVAAGYDGLYEKLCSTEMLRLGWMRVKQTAKDSHGIDGMTNAMFRENLEQQLATLYSELKTGTYRCRPLRRCYISKTDGGRRPLGLACIRDRVVQSACLMLLEPIFEPIFSSYSFAFRPHRNAHQAVVLSRSMISTGHTWVVIADIQKCFDNIDHDVLLDLLAAHIGDQALLRLIRHWLSVDVLDFHESIPTMIGVPQGESLSPLLANVYLTPMDRHFERLGFHFIRYADDIIVFTETNEKAQEALHVLEDFLLAPLKLSLKPAKTNIAAVSEGFDFLGFRIASDGIAIKDKKLDDVLELIQRHIQRIGNSSSFAQRIESMIRINAVIRGFRNYFAMPGEDLASQLQSLDGRVEMMAKYYLPADIKDDPAWICRERFALPMTLTDPDSLEEGEEEKAKTGTGYPDGHLSPQPDPWMLKDHSVDESVLKPSVVVEDPEDDTGSDGNDHACVEEGDRLYILTHGSYLTLQNERLIVKKQKKEVYSRSLHELGLVFLQGFGMTISVALQLKLAELDIPVVLAPPVGTPLAVLNSIRSTKSRLRYCQALRRDDTDIVSTGLGMVAAKVGNQAAVLRYFAKYRKKMKLEMGWKLTDTADKITIIADRIRELEPSIASARTVAMGLEGHAAAIYWHQVLSFVPEAMGFNGRITRYAKDVFNQCLNYVYGILYGEVWRAIVKVGLDPYFGLMHCSQRDQGSLVFDLIEEFRAPFADRLVISMIGRNFQPEVGRHGFLKTKARKQLAISFSKRWQKKIPWRSHTMTPGAILESQAVSLSRLFNRDGNYHPYRMRW